MKADEIRAIKDRLVSEANEQENLARQAAILTGLAATMWAEIAAQLSEANEYLKMYSNPPMVFEGTHLNPDAFSDLPQPITFIPSEPRATLRDQFAMAAMQGLFSACQDEFWVDIQLGEKTTTQAYMWADKMMEARK